MKSKIEWSVWFGIIKKDGKEIKLVKSTNFVESFKKASNDPSTLPMPFSIKKIALNIFKDESEYYKALRDTAINVTSEKIKKELSKDDKYVIVLLKMLDSLNEMINVLFEKVKDVEEIKKSEVCILAEERIQELKKLKSKVEKEIELVMEKLAPNLTKILGANVAARLLERAGSLEKLAKMPSSTIQLLGAEKSLYKAMARIKKGKHAKIPKHGIIFQHPFVRFLPKNKRGKMARFLAAKASIAAKIDYFGGKEVDLFKIIKNKYEVLRRT